MPRKPDITLARTLLGFEPRIGWRAGLTETVAWFRQALAVPAATVSHLDDLATSWIATGAVRFP